MKATGEFDVNIQPLKSFTQGNDTIKLGHMSIDKVFCGDLEAKSLGEMLNVMTNVEGSAGYVALEQVEGTLQGKRGSFVLQHFGMMSRGESRLVLEVVPDSGTGDLAGLVGKMTIEIKDGQHFYEFDYSLG